MNTGKKHIMEFRIESVRRGQGTGLDSFVPVIWRISFRQVLVLLVLSTVQMSKCTLILLLDLFSPKSGAVPMLHLRLYRFKSS